MGINGDLLELYGESPEAAELWSVADPTSSTRTRTRCRMDGNPRGSVRGPFDGASTRSTVRMRSRTPTGRIRHRSGRCPLPEEAFVNYRVPRSYGFVQRELNLDGVPLPSNFTTRLFDNIGDLGAPDDTFSTEPSGSGNCRSVHVQRRAADPLSADTDDDGMPDGWGIWFARRNLLDDAWTLNPLDSTDCWQDADDDGMTNWEEYNVVSPMHSETDSNRSLSGS